MLDDHAMPMAPFMEVLTTTVAGHLIGYRLHGCYTGPTVVIAASEILLDPLASRFTALPTLPWMRGTLILVDIDAIGDGTWHPTHAIDATLALPVHSKSATAEMSGFRSILRLCNRLGMIKN